MVKDPHQHRIALIPELPSKTGGRLGRHIHFDERSRNFRVQVTKKTPIQSRIWKRTTAAFNQGSSNACTGNGAAGLLCTEPYKQAGLRCNEALAKRIYSLATHKDHILGVYPPDDTGSTVLAAMKSAKELGFAKGYRWGFGLDDVLKTLSTIGPVEVGLNWYEGFDKPTKSGLVKISGHVRGGHAFELLGLDADKKLIWAINSWGPGFGVSGVFCFSWDDLDRLLHENGEAATLVI